MYGLQSRRWGLVHLSHSREWEVHAAPAQLATLSQLSAFSPGDRAAEAELPAACVHPAVTDILGSFPTGARNNPFPPPASL